tara:strand:- start:3789 stop:4580 length:792 start_codon:yes stop_codon:yes gene_type:complete
MKILIIGKRSIIANYFVSKYKKKIQMKLLSLSQAKKISQKKINNFDWILNCSFKKNIHNSINNPDLQILKKIKNASLKYIMMSTAKVYGSKKFEVFKESKISKPKSAYGKLRLTTENKIIKSLGERALILRVSNVLIHNFNNNKKNFNTLDQMIYSFKNDKKIFLPKKKIIKDFVTLDFLVKNIFLLIKKNKYGIFNISSSCKISLEELAKIILKKLGSGNIIRTNGTTDSFLLSNKKLLNINKIKIKKKNILNNINSLKINI